MEVKLISDMKGALLTEGVSQQGAEENIFGPRRDEVTGGWRGRHNEGIHNLYSLPSISSTNGEKGYAYRLLVGKRPLGRTRYRLVDLKRQERLE
jgi:hypothetical protein